MTTLMDAWNWIKANLLITAVIAITVIILFFPKMLKGVTGSTRRVHHRRLPVHHRRLPVHHTATTRRRKLYTLHSNVRHKARPRSKNGKVKKAWQIKGSRAARLHMASIRRLRRA